MITLCLGPAVEGKGVRERKREGRAREGEKERMREGKKERMREEEKERMKGKEKGGECVE